MAKLFIVGFPKDFQQIALVELFSAHGMVNTVTLVTDKETGDPKGYGFITMSDEVGANRAIQALDGTSIDGRTVSVRFAEEKQGVKPAGAGAAYPRHDNRVQQKPKRPRRS
ncbi:RNA-binding protein [Mucilaginibacter sp. BJC16-A38]|uniref:RNA recognition motif domain-containing protein n=1 Tax=Mucilaginibacter phenanthrenivorans TaxID=1234842 RepID=UPI002157A175|nr:RNA-binding protein [Mucilaginibacter phenanthrenivorans]MCR8556524.1 RNA-binding protein [Mucilaginibacter phenanthrenivorans]